MANASISPVARLQQFLRVESSDILTIGTLIVGVGILSLATPVAIQALVNIVTMGGVLGPLYVIAFILFVLLSLSGALYILQTYLVEHIQRRFFVRTAIEAAHKTQTSKESDQQSHNTAELMNRFLDVTTVQKSVAKLLTAGLTSILQAAIGSIVLMFYSFYFAIIVLLMLATLWLIVRVIGKNAVNTAIDESVSKYQVVAWLETIANNINAFKFLQGKFLSQNKVDKLAVAYLNARKSHFSILLKQNIAGVFLYASAGTAMLALGGALVIKGQINLGQFVAAELIIFNVLASFSRFIYQLETFYDLLAAFDKIGMIQDLNQEAGGAHLSATKKIEVHFNHVTYAYPNQYTPVKDISFALAAGQTMAVLAKPGSGKSIFAELLVGLKSPTSGYIQYNNIDIKQYDIESTRELVGYARKLELLEDTIAENIRFGRPNINAADITNVLGKLGILETVLKLDKNIDTKLSQSGVPLSTIQAKLITLARTIIREPAILVIDGLLDDFDKSTLDNVMRLLCDDARTWSLVVFTKHPYIAAYCSTTMKLNEPDGFEFNGDLAHD